MSNNAENYAASAANGNQALKWHQLLFCLQNWKKMFDNFRLDHFIKEVNYENYNLLRKMV